MAPKTNTGNSIVPVKDEDRRFSIWQLEDIYTGKEGSKGRYVPNVGDMAVSYDSGFWKCIDVDYNTGYSTLIPWNFANLNQGITKQDVILGGGPGSASEFYRIYVNTSVVPYEFSIDTRLRLYGSSGSYIKIFKEGQINGTSISAQFNARGVMVSENIELENVVIPNTTVTAIKTPKQGHLTEQLENGEVVSVVVYSNSGAVLSIFKLVVVNTNFVRTINAGKKLITDIKLISPYLSHADNTLLEYPANMTIDTGSLVGRVTYNDGTSQTYPVDKTKFTLHGINNYVVTQIGQTVPLVLSYKLADDEFSNTVKQVGNERFINASYRLTTIDSDNMYSVKLFVVPYWDKTKDKWNLEYYLTNLDRDFIYRVTPYIEYATNSKPFDGTVDKFGSAQKITVALNLDRIAPTFKAYRHVTTFIITTHQVGENVTRTGYYTLEYDADSIVTKITDAKYKESNGSNVINISGGRTVVDTWLRDIYWVTDPLYFPFAEAHAPTPTHVKVIIGDTWSREIPTTGILNDIIDINVPISTGDLIRLEFIANHNSSRLVLATVGLTAHPLV